MGRVAELPLPPKLGRLPAPDDGMLGRMPPEGRLLMSGIDGRLVGIEGRCIPPLPPPL
jgi:hypothetical protein